MSSSNETRGNGAAWPGMFSALRYDLPSSVVVFLVALPLCMGIAIASGAPVSAGLITGIVGGIVAGSLSGAPLQVSGPAAGLTVIVLELVRTHGLEMLGFAVLIAGGLQLAAGLLRLGQWFRAVSPAVVQGMLAGIGVLIFSSQFHVMVDDKPKESGVRNLLTIPQAAWKGLPWSELGTRDQRQARSELLKELGDVREQQVQIRELFTKHVADPTGNGAAEAWARRLAPRQRRLTARIDELTERLNSLLSRRPELDSRGNLREAVSELQQQSRQALAFLEQKEVGEVQESQAALLSSLQTVLQGFKDHATAAKVGILTIVMILVWQGVMPRRLRVIPGPLVAICAATALAAVLQLPVLYVEIPQNIWSQISFPTLSSLKEAPLGELLTMGAVIAVVASAETLLCATAVDQMHTGPRANFDRELTAQGAGNMICGLLGALPMTGVIVRSAANVQAGARTRASAICHGIWLLLFVSFLSFLLQMIPTSGLAAILVYTGYKLMNPQAVRRLWQYGWSEVGIYAATVTMIVVTDLLTGILVGIALSAVKLLYLFSHLHADLEVDNEQKKAVLSLEGAATFIRLPVLAAELERVPRGVELHVNFEHLDYIDHACLDLLMTWARQHDGKLVIDWDSLHAKYYTESARNGRNGRNSRNGLARRERETAA